MHHENLAKSEMEPPPPVGQAGANQYIVGVSNKPGKLVIFLDIEVIFESSKNEDPD